MLRNVVFSSQPNGVSEDSNLSPASLAKGGGDHAHIKSLLPDCLTQGQNCILQIISCVDTFCNRQSCNCYCPAFGDQVLDVLGIRQLVRNRKFQRCRLLWFLVLEPTLASRLLHYLRPSKLIQAHQLHFRVPVLFRDWC